jgi:hypothetical protein
MAFVANEKYYTYRQSNSTSRSSLINESILRRWIKRAFQPPNSTSCMKSGSNVEYKLNPRGDNL